MATLYVMRHAKSRWDEKGVDDVGRGLSPRGVADAPLIGRHVRERGAHVELVVTSHATRAYATAAIVAEQLGGTRLVVDERLYLCSPDVAAQVVREHGAGVASMMIVGHNPAWTQLLAEWAGEYIDNLPTAAVACIESSAVHLSQFTSSNNRLQWIVRPKHLR